MQLIVLRGHSDGKPFADKQKSKKEEARVLIGRGGTLLHCPSDCTVVPPPIPDALFEPHVSPTENILHRGDEYHFNMQAENC